MNCVLMVQTDCCTNNCLKADEKDSSVDEYEAGSSESEEEEEETDKASVQTCVKFPDKWRP